MRYLNILRKDEQKRVNELQEHLYNKYDLAELDIDNLIVAFSTADKAKTTGIREYETFSILGDKYLDTGMYRMLIRDYGITIKGKLDNYRQIYNNRVAQSEYIISSGLIDYILLGNSTNMFTIKRSPGALHAIFEALIYVIHEQYGEEGVIKFLKKSNYIN